MTIRSIDPFSRLDEIFEIYCLALALSPSAAAPAQWRDEILLRHASRNDFRFLAALEGRQLAGFGYGYTGAYGTWWTDWVALAMDEATRRRWLDPPHFEVVELHVRPERQRQGIGTRLLDELLRQQPHDRAVLTTDPARPQAMNFYSKHGWSRLTDVRWTPESPPRTVLGKQLKPSREVRRQTWVALLRGLNLGARNKVAMADLRRLLSDMGAEDVTTYVQSGNVVFRSSGARGDLADAIRKAIRHCLGLDVAVLLRTTAELARLIAGNPFAAHEPEPTKLLVTFLAEPPDRGRVERLEEMRFQPDQFRVTRDAVYLHCPDGYGRSKMSNAFLENQLGVAATTRNWRTVTALTGLANA